MFSPACSPHQAHPPYGTEAVSIYALLKDQAYDQILALINTGALRQGEIYSLSWITDQLQMSRTPVRDALHKLCDEHRLEVLPSRGFRLRQMEENEYLLRFHFSNAIEGYCVAHLAQHAAGEPQRTVIRQLHALQDELQALVAADAPFEAFYRCDNEFHLCIMQTFGEAFYERIVAVPGFHNCALVHQVGHELDRSEILTCHHQILAAIDAGDVSRATQALQDHALLMYQNFKAGQQQTGTPCTSGAPDAANGMP